VPPGQRKHARLEAVKTLRCRLRLRAVAKTVQRDVEDVVDLAGVARGDLGDADHHVHDVRELDVRSHGAGFLGAFEQWLAGGEQGRATLLKERGVLIVIVEQLVRGLALSSEIGDQKLEPAIERLPRIAAIKLRGGASHIFHSIDV